MKNRYFIVEPREFGYYVSTFKVVEKDNIAISPKVGDIISANNLFTIVANGCEVLIQPKQ